ncbi:MAG: hypothetical protein LQ352_005892 [Teloschistes flavicans]|nr:MAG: hypothetical protein LQ352_005892 [Teloschistes flavicans]
MSLPTAFQQLPPLIDSNLGTLFERLQTRSPTIHELQDFRIALDLECSLRLRDSHVDTSSGISSGTLIAITLYFSGPLLLWRGSDSGRYLEVQLRALVGALALLHHCGVTGLAGEVHDQLRTNIAGRFNDIIDGRRASQLNIEERKRKSDALYLIRLADQYFSLLKRAQPWSDAVSIPVLGLVLAGASIAGGQYSSLHSAFKYADHVIGLIPGRRGRHLNLPAIQELSRNAVFRFRSHEGGGGIVDLDQAVVDAELIHQLCRDHIQEIPSRRIDAWDWPLARLRRGPPVLNNWYFFYGLLDCVAQLAPYHDLVQIPADLLRKLRQLGKSTEWEEFGWKIEEILTCYGTSCPTESDPSELGHSSPSDQESHEERYIEGDLDPWEQDGKPQVRQLLPHRGFFRRGLGYAHAGLSANCRLAFFHDPEKIRVYRTSADGQAHRQGDLVFERKFDKSFAVAEVSLSAAVLAVSTRQTLELYDVGSHGPNLRPLEIIQHGDWDPSGLAIHGRSASEVVIAVGHRRGTDGVREGRIVLHRVMLSRQASMRTKIVSSSELPMQEVPRSISFSGDHLVCITDVTNTVFIWKNEGECFPTSEPAKIKRYDHRPETDSEGVTSAAMFQSRAGRSYVLCTSSAPTERYRSHGEWPFCSPIDPPEHVPPSSQHDLTALKDSRQLAVGAVSSVANVFAVLEKSGRILLLPLSAHTDGGIHTRNMKPDVLRDSLCQGRTSRGSVDSLKFDPAGRDLYAIDPDGKLIVVSFQPG